jgi:comEA protein
VGEFNKGSEDRRREWYDYRPRPYWIGQGEVGELFRRLGCIFALVVMFGGVPCDSWLSALQSQGKAAKPQAAAIDINKATANDLQKLPGIGPSLAKQIVAYREKHGPFRRVEDLMVISGIGFKKWKQIRPYVRVGERR